MAVGPHPSQKAAMLSAFVDYVLKNGMSDLSLRPAAAALGTSPRMLLYYFGSKEALLTAAIAQAREREIGMFVGEVQKWGAASPAQIFRAIWKWYSADRRAAYQRFFFEVYGIALRNPTMFRDFLHTVGSDFLSFTENSLTARGFGRREARALATLHLATIRGLLYDLLTTGDRTRLDVAAEVVAKELERALRGHPAPRTITRRPAAARGRRARH